MLQVTLEPVVFSNPSHLSDWYFIRSEESVRYGCRSVKKITPAQHREWWEASMKNKARQLFFIRQAIAPTYETIRTVGIVRVDHRGSWMEVWLAVKPEARNRKIATRALAMLCEKAYQARWPPLGAVVNGKKNTPSWRLFTRAGFITSKNGFTQLIRKGRCA